MMYYENIQQAMKVDIAISTEMAENCLCARSTGQNG